MADDGKLSVLTLNAWGIPYVSKDREIRMACIADELAKGLYDIVTLQEIWSYNDYKQISEKVKSVLPYSHHFYSGIFGSGVSVFSHYPILDVLSFRYFPNGYMYNIHHGDWFGGKSLGLCVIAHPKQLIHFFATHIHASYPDNSYVHHRVSQAYQITRYIQHVTRPSGVTILCGDMNCTPSELCYRIITDTTCLRDAWLEHAEKHPNGGNTCDVSYNSYTSHKVSSELIGGPNDGQRIDYIFYDGNEDVIECTDCDVAMGQIPGKPIPYSDHVGVTATFLIKNSSPEPSAVYSKAACKSDHNGSLALTETEVVICEGIDLHYKGTLKKILIVCVLLVLIMMPLFLPSAGWLVFSFFYVIGVSSAVVLMAYFYYVIFNAYEEIHAYRALLEMIKIQRKQLHSE